MKKYGIEIKWAVIFVIMTLAWMALEKAVGLHDTHIEKHPIYTNLVAIPAIIIYILALLEKRIKDLGGYMTYMQGFITGLKITIIIAILSPLTQYITSTFITPDYYANAAAYAVKKGMMTREAADNYFTLKNYMIIGFVGAIIMGIITSAIVAIFTRRAITTQHRF